MVNLTKRRGRVRKSYNKPYGKKEYISVKDEEDQLRINIIT